MTAPAPAAERLSQAHMAWLKEFSVVMHRRYAYPPKHPSRVAAEGVAFAALNRALEQFPEIVLMLTKRQVAIDGAYSDPKNPALGELAERLHRQGIASVTIRAGVTPAEFDSLLDRIVEAKPAGPDDDALPGYAADAHVAIDMLSYEGLALSDEDEDEDGPDGTGDRLWQELAEAALAGWDGYDEFGNAGGGNATDAAASGARPSGAVPVQDASPDAAATVPAEATPDDASQPRPSVALRPSMALRRAGEMTATLSAQNVARMISARAKDPQHAATVMKSLLKVSRHARRRGRKGSGAVAIRLREVLEQLEPGTFKSFLDSELDPAKKQALLLQGVDALPVSAVIDWIEAAAASGGNGITPYLLRLLKKLSSQTHRRRDAGPDEGGEAMREAARQLIEGWTLTTNETDAHTGLLEKIAKYDTKDAAADGGGSAGADRIVQIALETNVCGTDVIGAVDLLIEEKRLSLLYRFLNEVDGASVAAPAIGEHLLEPETVRRVLLSEPIEQDGALQLLQQCESPQVEAILDALTISESEATRRLVLDRLRELGDSVRGPLLARLSGSPWYTQRNILSLLADLPHPPTDLPFEEFTKHEEPMLRLEALRLLARIPERRETAIHDALGDPDIRVVRGAFEMAAEGLPRRSGQRLLQRLEKSERGSELRLRGIPLLSQVPLPAARDWLLPQVTRIRGVFMFRRLAFVSKSPEMLAALRVLAIRWHADPAVAPALKLAAKSDDRQIVDAGAARGDA